MYVSRRALDRVYSLILLAIVLLSWGFVVYACRLASLWYLENLKVPTSVQTRILNDN